MKMQFSKQNNIYLDHKSENGWLLITMALILPLVLIAIAFVVDLGRSYILKEEIRQAADGALVATGKVYLERGDLKDGKNNSTSPPSLSTTDDKSEVE
jgi:Flp pilus assembly protein TadG